jgi:hypothetical protein
VKFRKKPVVVEARQWHATDEQREEFLIWFREHDLDFRTYGPTIHIDTPDGTACAQLGDWVICGADGEFSRCSPADFAAAYEPVPSSALPWIGSHRKTRP